MKVVVIDGVKYAPVEEKVEQKILGTGRYALTDLAKALLILHEEYPWWKVDVSLNEEDEEIIIKTRGWFIWISLGGETEG